MKTYILLYTRCLHAPVRASCGNNTENTGTATGKDSVKSRTLCLPVALADVTPSGPS